MLHEILKRRPRRPLLIPALVLIAAVNLYSLFRTYPSESLDISCRAYVRHVESRLDGTTELELKTTEYGRILYRGTQDDGLSLGDTLSVTGYLKVYGEPSNPGEFDYGGYLHRRGIAGVLYADSITVLNEAPLAVKTAAGIQKLFDEVWGDSFYSDSTLNVHIRRLREKLEENPNEPKYIKTIWGTGYILETNR